MPSSGLPWREVLVTTLVPTALHAAGRGAILPIIPVAAVEGGASLGTAGLISALLLVGGLIGDLPGGMIVARVGERAAMIGAAALSVAGALAAVLIPHPLTLAIGVLVIGLASAVFALARHAFLAVFVPVAYRARALSTLGGTFRLGMAVGPFVTAGLLQVGAPTMSAFWVMVAGSVGAALVLVFMRDPEKVFGAVAPRGEAGHGDNGLFSTIRTNGRVLATVGTGSAVMAALRASRQVILPLWAVAIGIGEATTSLIIGIAMLLDFALFYAGGWMLDRLGRRVVGLGGMAGLAVCHLMLAASFLLPGREWWFVGLALALALVNGLTAGILMTLGADLADPRDPAPFLGAWRFTNDSGAALAPLAIAGLTALASLPGASIAIGALGLGGTLLWRLSLPKPPTRSSAG